MASGKLAAAETVSLIDVLRKRFEKHGHRHEGIAWGEVAARLEGAHGKLWSLRQMEASGGEPDVVGRVETGGAFLFVDCSPESPKERRSLCYDAQALEERKEHKPAGSALELAAAFGIELLDEKQYRALQQLDAFDTKTSSWIRTPVEIRKLGGALFCDRRYDQVFVYHNGASSYYAARGFRGMLEV